MLRMHLDLNCSPIYKYGHETHSQTQLNILSDFKVCTPGEGPNNQPEGILLYWVAGQKESYVDTVSWVWMASLTYHHVAVSRESPVSEVMWVRHRCPVAVDLCSDALLLHTSVTSE